MLESEPTDIPLWKYVKVEKVSFPPTNPIMYIYTFTIYRPLTLLVPAPPETEDDTEAEDDTETEEENVPEEEPEPVEHPLDLKVDTTVIIHNGFRVYNLKPDDDDAEKDDDGNVIPVLIDLQSGTDI